MNLFWKIYYFIGNYFKYPCENNENDDIIKDDVAYNLVKRMKMLEEDEVLQNYVRNDVKTLDIKFLEEICEKYNVNDPYYYYFLVSKLIEEDMRRERFYGDFMTEIKAETNKIQIRNILFDSMDKKN